MLKLPKGLKKKKTKKSKKNQELFTEEELEQFKRDQKAKQLAEQEEAEKQAQAQNQQAASTSKPKTDDDEWSKFTQLTSGIDSILKKTQGDLTRIKEQSFFQKVQPKKPEVKSPESDKPQEEPKPILTEEELEEQRRLAALKQAVVELSESESESDEEVDIFNTNYIDELASGILPLAYVPDSPEEEDFGPDPFDTNFADKVIKGPEVSQRGKKIVHIGSAVEVLTGRIDNVAVNKEALRRPRRGPQNLLLSSFDQDKDPEEEITAQVNEVVEQKPILSLLDDPTDVFADVPIDISTSLHLEFYKKKQEEEREAERLRKELEKDEFDELAAESLTKADVIVVAASEIVTEPIASEAGDWKSEFEVQAELGIVDVYDDDFVEEDVDPFDTQFIATVVREKSIDDDDFDPRAGEEATETVTKIESIYSQSLTVKPKDLLSGSTSDLTDLSHVPVISTSESIETEIDPFDTSAISELVQPKETEIKFLEKELLQSSLKHSLSDPDFDPRSDEPTQAQIISTAERKSSLSLNISRPASKSVGFDVSGGSNTSDGKKKPVTPYYLDKPIEDTSDISDSDFDPRAVTPAGKKANDLLSVGEATIDIQVLTPAASSNQLEEFSIEDPFQNDTPVIQMFNQAKDKEPFQELPLQGCYSVSDISAQPFDQFGKIFTLKLQYILYKERPGLRPGQVTKAERITNKLSQFAAYAIQGDYQGVKEFGSDLKKLGLPVEHHPHVSELFKIGSANYDDVKHFSVLVEEQFFKFNVHRDRALTYKFEEVQVTAVDEFFAEQTYDGTITRQIARVRLFFLAFLNGMPTIELGVNDMWRQGKEVVGRHDIIPVATEEWIRLEGVEFHACVQQNEYERSRLIRFQPPDACYIELMRFRVRPPKNRELPLQVKATWIVTGKKVELRADVLVPGVTSRKLGQIPCEDVSIRFPIPECWIYLFRVEKHFRYGSVKSAHRRTGKIKGIERILGTVDQLQESLIEVTSGQAKYEHHHRSIVWRCSRLPKDGQGAYTTHQMVVRMALTSYDQIPNKLAEHCFVEYTMPQTVVSHGTIRSVSVQDSDSDDPPEKYVRYLSRYEYQVGIEYTQGQEQNAYLAATYVKRESPKEEKKPLPAPVPEVSDSDSDSN